jgi:hypothetical protein
MSQISSKPDRLLMAWPRLQVSILGLTAAVEIATAQLPVVIHATRAHAIPNSLDKSIVSNVSGKKYTVQAVASSVCS